MMKAARVNPKLAAELKHYREVERPRLYAAKAAREKAKQDEEAREARKARR